LIVTIPKSGTHLFGKCVSKILKDVFVLEKLSKDINITAFHHQDLIKKEIWDDKLLRDFNKVIIGIRDLRDVLVSFVFWMDKRSRSMHKSLKDYPMLAFLNWSKMSFDEKLLTIIKGDFPYPFNFFEYEVEQTLKVLKYPSYCISKFEDLVGDKGGGSRMLQEMEINKIAKYLDKDLSKDEITKIADRLFGHTWTFRSGQIGEWRKYFKDIHKHVFKEKYGAYLIDFGYEENYNW